MAVFKSSNDVGDVKRAVSSDRLPVLQVVLQVLCVEHKSAVLQAHFWAQQASLLEGWLVPFLAV
ncbi:hypothetical protein P608_21720 [Comamonas thiooxydans]|uniref:Uncharacterized protein n=1 Tax=Comamonas thiooxydans TaxID=363952 RepID=A0A096FHQ4_9BURK|nr:hypothetical protein P369_13820 [Comamonas thiooxydans]KGG98233.1 hypothetical protein P367_13170 [Comamonas thiooxydans]KGH03032.1 hypothetical protein P365_17435 [Comamonas thiooxydans]KGH06916.1 hypothetical protein P608_21720 [Comamonas thiooxydans]KGH10692.1 hypothetical protein P368_15510 [Comamonas thiooxydans]